MYSSNDKTDLYECCIMYNIQVVKSMNSLIKNNFIHIDIFWNKR